MPADLTGVRTFRLNLTPNGRFYVYDFPQTLSDLHVVKGLN